MRPPAVTILTRSRRWVSEWVCLNWHERKWKLLWLLPPYPNHKYPLGCSSVFNIVCPFLCPFVKYALILTKVRQFLEHSCAILSSFKFVVIFNITSAEIKTKSADVLSQMTRILKELRIVQLWSKNERTLHKYMLWEHPLHYI